MIARFRLSQVALIGALPLVFGFTTQFAPGLKPIPKEVQRGFNAITPNASRNFLSYLAGPECEGRGTGQPGYQKAAEYVAAHFKKLGLKSVMPDGSYFQYNDFWRIGTDASSVKFMVGDSKVDPKQIGIEVNGDLAAEGELVVVYLNGACGPLDDSIKAQIDGKVVLLRNESTLRAPERALTNLGAKSVVLITKTPAKPYWTGASRKPSETQQRVARFSLTPEAASKLVGEKSFALNDSPGENAKRIEATGKTALLEAKQVIEQIKVPNVVALVEGSDPVLKNEYVGVGAHLDHLGRRGNTIYYGADDDGSGSAGVMVLAEALMRNPVKPKRSTLLMAFYGEEMGLLGSKYLADNSPIPLDKMIAELQMDMIGRNSVGAQNGDQRRIDKEEENRDTMRLVGSKKISTRLDDIIQEQNQHIGFKFKYDSEDVYTRSDHYNFAAKGIPIAFFFSGFHPEYHQPTDTIEKINFDKIANTIKLVYLTVHQLGYETAPLPKIGK
jgi:hypothetical protein